MKNLKVHVAIFTALSFVTTAISSAAIAPWRTATKPELRKLIPARAPVVKENIETEFRTASGVTDGKGKFIAGVVMITAGYSAEGKYSHFFVTQVSLKMGDLSLAPGEYVFGYQRTSDDAIRVSFYRASSGNAVGEVEAQINRKGHSVTSLQIRAPASGKGAIQVGRFVWDYSVSE